MPQRPNCVPRNTDQHMPAYPKHIYKGACLLTSFHLLLSIHLVPSPWEIIHPIVDAYQNLNASLISLLSKTHVPSN